VLTDDEFRCFLKALGTQIKTLRKHKNFNMRDMMIASGYYDAQWRKYESGGSMNLMSLMKVAMALDVSITELFAGLGEWPKRSVAEIESKRSKASHSDPPDVHEQPSAKPMVTSKATKVKTKAQHALAPEDGASVSPKNVLRKRKSTR
jgi:transcriptional regulator with XRE-family HTH domain